MNFFLNVIDTAIAQTSTHRRCIRLLTTFIHLEMVNCYFQICKQIRYLLIQLCELFDAGKPEGLGAIDHYLNTKVSVGLLFKYFFFRYSLIYISLHTVYIFLKSSSYVPTIIEIRFSFIHVYTTFLLWAVVHSTLYSDFCLNTCLWNNQTDTRNWHS